jgi:hypothetical protein
MKVRAVEPGDKNPRLFALAGENLTLESKDTGENCLKSQHLLTRINDLAVRNNLDFKSTAVQVLLNESVQDFTLADTLVPKSIISSGLFTQKTPTITRDEKHIHNEICFNSVEIIDCIISNKQLISCSINGTVDCIARLSSNPTVSCHLSKHSLLNHANAAFHSCVNSQGASLEFTPPMNDFRLLQYMLPGTHQDLPLHFKTSLSFKHSKYQIYALARIPKEATLVSLTVTIPFPSFVTHASASASEGKANFDPHSQSLTWSIDSGLQEDSFGVNGNLELAEYLN